MNISWNDLLCISPPLGSPLAVAVGIGIGSLLIAIFVSQKLKLPLLSARPRKTNSSSSSSSSSSKDIIYKITKCPNPNCARCSRYAELNRSAQRRLPYVARGESLSRIRHAILAGPDVETTTHHDEEKDDATINTSSSPVAGQRPNVLLIRDLLTRPNVTSLHWNTCRTLEDLGKDIVLQEYVSACWDNSHSSTSSLENDVRMGKWQVLHLLNQGLWVQSNIDLCPQTTNAVQQSIIAQSIMNGCIFGNIFISVLYPGTVVDPHCGPSNVRHRLHFPLLVPSSSSTPVESEPELRVAKERITWTEGKCVVFDDSIVHSASYPAEVRNTPPQWQCRRRVVLIVDLWHPDLSIEERDAIRDLYPAAV